MGERKCPGLYFRERGSCPSEEAWLQEQEAERLHE